MPESSAGSTQKERPQEDDASSIPSTPSSKAVAPYTPRSEPEDQSLQQLINHYATYVTRKTVTAPGPRKEWFPFAAGESAFFHAIMASTASHLAYQRGQSGDNREYFYHRGAAIALVNRAIVTGTAATEAIIATVAAFTQQESLAASKDDLIPHIDGLEQLVDMAGGLMSSIFSPKTRRLILLVDLSAAIVLMQPPRLDPTLQDPDMSVYFKQPSSPTIKYATNFSARLYNFTEFQELSEAANTIYWGLRNLTQIIEEIRDEVELPDPSEEEVQFSDRVEILERCAHVLWYEDTKDYKPLIFRLFGMATLIYIYIVLRELPPQLRILKLIARRMKEQMEKSPKINVLLATFPDLMLWIVFLGGRVAESERKRYFARQASKILLVNKIEVKEDIVQASERFLWPERNKMEYEEIEEFRSESSEPLNRNIS